MTFFNVLCLMAVIPKFNISGDILAILGIILEQCEKVNRPEEPTINTGLSFCPSKSQLCRLDAV